MLTLATRFDLLAGLDVDQRPLGLTTGYGVNRNPLFPCLRRVG